MFKCVNLFSFNIGTQKIQSYKLIYNYYKMYVGRKVTEQK